MSSNLIFLWGDVLYQDLCVIHDSVYKAREAQFVLVTCKFKFHFEIAFECQMRWKIGVPQLCRVNFKSLQVSSKLDNYSVFLSFSAKGHRAIALPENVVCLKGSEEVVKTSLHCLQLIKIRETYCRI